MRASRTIVLSTAALVAVSSLVVGGAARADTGGVPNDPHCTGVSTTEEVTLGYFGKNPLLSVAEREGYFARQGIHVTYLTVTGSKGQFDQLEHGGYDLVSTAVDNVANYRLNTSNDLGHTLPVTAIAATDGGYNLQRFSRPGVSLDDFSGRTLGVDATNSGFAFIAYEILAQHGLAAPTKQADGTYRSTDYAIRAIGGVGGRYLNIAGKIPTVQPVDATLLSNGFDVLGAHAGLTRGEDVRDVTQPYLSGVIAGLDPWLAAHHCTAVRVTRALSQAAAFTTDPADAVVVTDDIRKDAPVGLLNGLSAQDYAEQFYAVTVTPGIGQFPTLDVPKAALLNTLALRQEYDGFDSPQNIERLSTPAGGLYEKGILQDAERG